MKTVCFDFLGSPVFLRFPELSLNERGNWSNERLESGGSNSLIIKPGHSPTSTTSATINGGDAASMAVQTGIGGGPSFCSTPNHLQRLTSPIAGGGDVNDNSVTEDDMHAIPEGSFFGFGLHRDGSLFGKSTF